MKIIFDLILIIRHNLLLYVIFAAFFMGSITTGIYLRKPAFDSTTKVLINFEGLGISLSRAEVQFSNTQVLAVEAITSQAEILRSREIVEKVIDEIGLEAFRSPPPTNMIRRIISTIMEAFFGTVNRIFISLGLIYPIDERDALVIKLSKSLDVYPVRQSQILIVNVRWNQPRLARLILSSILDIYLEKAKKNNTYLDEYDVYTAQSKRLSEELSTNEYKLLEFKLQNRIFDFHAEKNYLIARIENLSGLLDGTTDVIGDVAANADLSATASKVDRMVVTQVTSLQARLISLKVELAGLRVSSTPDSRAVRELESQIAEVKELIRDVHTQIFRSLAETKARLRIVNEAEASFERINRDVEMARDAYQTYRKVAEDRRVMQSKNAQIHVQVIDQPSLPVRPNGPSRLVLLIAGIPISLIVAFALVFLIRFYRIYSQQEEDHDGR